MRARLFPHLLLVLLWCQGAVAAERQWWSLWTPQAPLKEARAGAAAAVHNHTLYVIGGVDGREFLATVEYTRVRADGSLEPWRNARPLPQARGFVDAVAHDGWLYVVGGGNGPWGQNLLRSALRAKIQVDGSLGPWRELTAELLIPRRCNKLFIHDNDLYALGGFGGNLLDSVERLRLDQPGSGWRLLEERLTMPRYVNGVKRLGDFVYVLGGHAASGGQGLREVEMAALGRGELRWRGTSPMKQGRYGLAVTTFAGRLYALGGLSGLEYLSSVEMALPDREGNVGKWQKTTPLPLPLANFIALNVRDFLYIIGGTTRDGYRREVSRAEFAPDGGLGSWLTGKEAASLRSGATGESIEALPNQGRVLEVVEAAAYRYLRVVDDAGHEQWLAAPAMSIRVGQRIAYSRGVFMSNFYSKSLGRRFASILFVSRAERLP